MSELVLVHTCRPPWRDEGQPFHCQCAEVIRRQKANRRVKAFRACWKLRLNGSGELVTDKSAIFLSNRKWAKWKDVKHARMFDHRAIRRAFVDENFSEQRRIERHEKYNQKMLQMVGAHDNDGALKPEWINLVAREAISRPVTMTSLCYACDRTVLKDCEAHRCAVLTFRWEGRQLVLAIRAEGEKGLIEIEFSFHRECFDSFNKKHSASVVSSFFVPEEKAMNEAKQAKQGARELDVKQRHVARVLEVSDACVSDYFSGARRMPDDVFKKICFIYSFVRSERMRVGCFRFDKAGIALLRRKIREMQRSWKSPQPVSDDATIEESAPCPAN